MQKDDSSLCPIEYVTKKERESWLKSLLVSDLAIDGRYISITRRDIEAYRYGYLKDYWHGNHELGKRILSFNPEGSEKGFYLYGPPGVGKTAILKGLAIHLAKKYRGEVIFTQLKLAIDAMSEDEFANKQLILRKLVSARFLFIDDLGIERSSDWTREQIYSILDTRMFSETDGKKNFTFFSSNLSSKGLLSRYHGRDIRRIEDLAEIINVEPVVDSSSQSNEGKQDY